MDVQGRNVMVCDCERSMRLDGGKLGSALGTSKPIAIRTHLCRAELPIYEKALGEGGPLLVACTQEAPLFREIAEEKNAESDLAFVNIRERAGWSESDATPKIAALLADALVAVEPARLMTLKSDGSCLVYGRGAAAFEAAETLSTRMPVSLLLTDPDDLLPSSRGSVPVYRGRIASAKGHFGAFEVTVEGYAPLHPSSRATPGFAAPRDGARTQCSLILDLSGGTPLFPHHHARNGYLRRDPRDPAAVARALFEISGLAGEFEKPFYVNYDAETCAHSRSRKPGCTKCLDACPAGAIAPAGDIVVIDAAVCAGCGACSAHCPTGAVSYAYPRREDLLRRIAGLATTYVTAGGRHPKLLLHDESHGDPLIAAIARTGRGLPPNVIPLGLHSVLQCGHDILAATLAAGFEDVVLLVSSRRQPELFPIQAEIELLAAVLGASGSDPTRVRLLVEDDPDAVEAALYDLAPRLALPSAPITALGSKRTLGRAALARLNDTAPAPQKLIALPPRAPYGRVRIDTDRCTLCLACVSACPAHALSDNSEKPELRFVEQACVQCGLCVSTCPENALSLEPRLDFTSDALTPVTLFEEEPFACVRCSKPFGTRRTVERIAERLRGRHWMFPNEQSAAIIMMCEDCRVITVAERGNDPFGSGPRPKILTGDEPRPLTSDDFFKGD